MIDRLNEISTNPLLVVCDTCIYVKDFRLTNSDWTKIAAILKTHSNAKLVLPDAIEQEILKKLEELGETSLNRAEKESTSAKKRLINFDVDWTNEKKKLIKEIKGYVQKIKTVTEGRLLKTPMPEVSLSECFGRAIRGEKPFKMNPSDGGYTRAVDGLRDTVIWESVKEVYRKYSDATVVFYTTNSTDFADQKSKQLHPQLLSEINKIRKDGKGFFFVQDETGLEPFLKETEFVAGVEDNIREFIDKNSEQIKKALASPDDEFSSEHDNGLTVEHYNLESLSIQKFYKESETTILAEAVGEFEVEVEFFINKSEYYSMNDNEEDEISIIDPEWNDHVMLAGKSDTWTVHVLATIPSDASENKVLQVTINGNQINPTSIGSD